MHGRTHLLHHALDHPPVLEQGVLDVVLVAVCLEVCSSQHRYACRQEGGVSRATRLCLALQRKRPPRDYAPLSFLSLTNRTSAWLAADMSELQTEDIDIVGANTVSADREADRAIHHLHAITSEEQQRGVGQVAIRQDAEALVVTVVALREGEHKTLKKSVQTIDERRGSIPSCPAHALVGVPVHKLPGLALFLRVGELDIVGDDVDLVGLLLADEVRENAADDRYHAAGHNNDRDVVLLGVLVEVLEAGVKGDV